MIVSAIRVLLALAVIVVGGCDGRGPVQPTGSSPAVSGESFEVTGIVTDERGAPMPGATVTMGYYQGGLLQWSAVRTDASGGYRVGFTARASGTGFVARAQVLAEGYEEYWRSLSDSNRRTFVENFRLYRTTRIAAGDSVVLSVPPDVGECVGWVAEACPYVGVTVPTPGHLTIEVTATDPSAPAPPVEVCCVGGDERYGNPITVPVPAGIELDVKVGVQRNFTTPRSFLVTTAFEPSF